MSFQVGQFVYVTKDVPGMVAPKTVDAGSIGHIVNTYAGAGTTWLIDFGTDMEAVVEDSLNSLELGTPMVGGGKLIATHVDHSATLVSCRLTVDWGGGLKSEGIFSNYRVYVPQASVQSKICPCGIFRGDCDYHR